MDSFKTELIADRVWRTQEQAELAIVEWVSWYNHARLHSSLGDIPPVEYEQLHASAIPPLRTSPHRSRTTSFTSDTSRDTSPSATQTDPPTNRAQHELGGVRLLARQHQRRSHTSSAMPPALATHPARLSPSNPSPPP